MITDKNPAEIKDDKLEMDESLQGMRSFEIIFVILMLLSVIGVAITDFSRKLSPWFWFAMVPVFAVGCLVIEWTRARRSGMSSLSILRMQLLIWLGLLVAASITYVLLFTGRLNYENTGLVMLLLLAFATYFTGLILDYRLCLLGISLATTLLVMALLEEYLWVVLLLGVIGVATTLHHLSKKKTQ